MIAALRAVAVLHAITLFLQPVLAGMFLSGQDGAIDSHTTNAMIVATLCLVQTVLAGVLWRGKNATRQIFTQSLAMFILEVLQITVGFQHTLWIHIPLGTLLMAGTAVLMRQIMGPQASVGAPAPDVPNATATPAAAPAVSEVSE